MSNLPSIIPAKRRVHRKQKQSSPTAAPATVSIVSVTGDGDGNGVVLFDSQTITAVTDVSQLEVEFNGDWLPSDTIVGFTANTITVTNPIGFDAGREWRVISPMGVTWDDDPSITMDLPAGGTVL